MPAEVFLIRHGQSQFNAAVDVLRRQSADVDQTRLMAMFDELRRDPAHRDTPLSPTGQLQVAEAAAQARALQVDVVLVSPLTRALQTAIGLFGPDLRMEASHLHAERVFSSCDLGRSPSALTDEFPSVSFAHLDDPWWFCPDGEGVFSMEPDDTFAERVVAFRDALAARPEERIAVVGHGLFFEAVCGRHLDNCEILSLEWPMPASPAARQVLKNNG